MATVDDEQPTGADRAAGRDGPNWAVWVTTATAVLGVLIGGGALLRDYFGWERRAPATAPGSPGTGGPLTSGGSPGSATGTDAPPAPGPAGVHVDSLPVEAGADNLVALPPPLDGRADLDRAIAVACPENTARDGQREVTYALRRRYRALTLTIRAYSPDDPPAVVRVTVNVAVQRADGTIDRLTRGSADARQDAPGTLAADVAGADDLVLRVECESPTSTVLITDARITVPGR